MSTYEVTPPIARAEIARRANNRRLKAAAQAAGTRYSPEPPADPSLIAWTGPGLASVASADGAPTAPKARKAQARKAPAAPKARKNPEANDAFAKALAENGLAAAFKAYKAVMQAQAA